MGPGPTVRKKPIIGLLQAAGVVVLMLLAFIYSRPPGVPDEASAAKDLAAAPGKSAPLVSVVRPSALPGQLAVTSTGSVAVRSYVTLTPQVSGRVVATSPALRSGGSFAAGETLVTLDQRDFILALAQVQADVTSAQASLQLSQAEASAAIANYQMLSPGKKTPPLVAKAPQIAQAKAQLQAAIARRDIQQVNLERSVFSLPFSGLVVESSADEGQMLSTGQSFGRVYALDAVEIVITLAPEELAKIAPAEGRVAMITADGLNFEGRIARVAAERDPRTRFSKVYLTASNSESLTPGTFVSVKLNGPAIENTFKLPESALQVGQSFWIVKDGAITGVDAIILGRSNGHYLVEAFDYGDGIVTGAVPGARDGLPIRLAETD
ncbi:efflux RND transporter periplasmic adaptor subunit [Zhongshania sp.]|jgi:RND family efflux transporter MFP subunit|uniref:efflux RND transporter periplasmic adaptor subunit n=1 Tax=Zhongshania sp. TaxID=1971902 RepID=UPI0039E5CC3A